MTAIPPSTPQTPSAAMPQTAAGAAVATVISANIPPALAALELRALIEVTVLGAGPGAGTVQVTIKGEDAPVTLRLAQPLPPQGATLSLQLVSQGSQGTAPQLRVLAVDGQPTAGAIRPPAPPSPVQIAAPPPAEVEGAIPLSASLSGGTALLPIYDATLLRTGPPPLPLSELTPTDLPQLPAGTVLTVRVASSSPPPPATTPESLPTPVSTPPSPAAATVSLPQDGEPPLPSSSPVVAEQADPSLPSSPAPQSSLPSSPSPPLPSLPAGTPSANAQTSSAILAPQSVPPDPDADAMASPASTPSLGSFVGIVAANSNCGLPLLQTAFGLLSLDAPLGLVAGSRVLFDLLAAKSPDPADRGRMPEMSRNWPSLNETLQVLRNLAPAVAQQLSERLPQLGPHFAMGLVAFAAAASKGELWKWLGETAAASLAKEHRQDLASALESELGQVAGQVYVSHGHEEWQAWMVPLLVDGRLERFRMMARRHASGDERARRSDEGARFLLDLDLSETGKMQIDGLVKRAEKRFDLIVRTHSGLPKEMRQDIRAIFARSLDGLGFAGEAVFQETPRFVEPVPVAGPSSALEI